MCKYKPISSEKRFLMALYTWSIVHQSWTSLICSPSSFLKPNLVSLGMLSGWWSCPQGGVKFKFLYWIHVYDDNFNPRRILWCIVLILLYTFMVSSLCLRNYFEQMIGHLGIIQLSMCEELVCVFLHYSIIRVWGTRMCILLCSIW